MSTHIRTTQEYFSQKPHHHLLNFYMGYQLCEANKWRLYETKCCIIWRNAKCNAIIHETIPVERFPGGLSTSTICTGQMLQTLLECWASYNTSPTTVSLYASLRSKKKSEPTWIHEACIMQHMTPFTAVEIRFLSCTKLCFAPQTQAMRLDHQGCLLIPLRRGMEEDQFSHCTLGKSEVLSATSHHYTLFNSKNM